MTSVLPSPTHFISQTLNGLLALSATALPTPASPTVVHGTYSEMISVREITTCSRCRQSKRKCDKAKPSCTRCERGGVQCTYDEDHQEDQVLSQEANGGSDPQYPTPVTTPPTSIQRVRKRNRACLSCVRCHRLKIKCDQKEPCSRCSRSRVQCTYTDKPKPPQDRSAQPPRPSEVGPEEPYRQEVPFALTEDDPEFVVATWFLRKRGSTHYRAILNRVSDLLLHLSNRTRTEKPLQLPY